MEKQNQYYLIGLTLLTLIVGGVVDILLKEAFPHAYFEAYPFIPLYFYVLELLVYYGTLASRRGKSRQAPLWLMAIKMVKLVGSVLVAVLYCLLMKEHVRDFLLVFVLFYLLYLTYETLFFAAVEKRRESEQKEKNENGTIS
ncbi:MAG: hypothetical protein LBN24_06740 [Mediterranea sp.]|jgi:uncharacterized membrane protein YhaH (DUF805 family)|nr:hypothetical protein [Mediterranea sp.]